MAIVFRADASAEIGNGHIMRCLTLADELAGRGETIHFVCRSLTQPAQKRLELSGHVLHVLPGSSGENDRPIAHAHWLSATWQEDAEQTRYINDNLCASWILVDHYGVDACWETAVRSAQTKVGVIDDLADRSHSCDLLLDQTMRSNAIADYGPFVPPHAQKLFGLRYALLRPEFSPRDDFLNVTHAPALCVAFSGSDRHGLTRKTLLAVRELQSFSVVRVIASSDNIDLQEIRVMCKASNWDLHVDASDVGAIMRKSQLAIGAGGGMLWERAACGLPSIAISVADNQNKQILDAERAGLVVGLLAEDATAERIAVELHALSGNANKRAEISANCVKAIDGKGRMRVADRLLQQHIVLRKAVFDDSQSMREWRNDERVRRYSGSNVEISPEQHAQWFSAVLNDPRRHLLIASDEKGSLGVVRFDCTGDAATISIYLVPERMGEGRGAGLLLESEAWLRQNLPETHRICADVLERNVASVELFQSCGYLYTAEQFQKNIRTQE